jgi:hypothetical protein
LEKELSQQTFNIFPPTLLLSYLIQDGKELDVRMGMANTEASSKQADD